MDIATIVGILAGIGLIGTSLVMGGGIGGFIDIPSIMIVGGGTLAATLINFPLKQVLSVLKVTKKLILAKEEDPIDLIRQFIQLAVIVRKDGQLALENEAKNVTNPFLQKGLMLVADGVDAEELNSILQLQNLAVQQRHKVGQEVFKAMGKWSPAFGMIGTLIGLVQMLSTMEDPKTIGPKMAIALITTFYGALIANLFALPMAGKLKQRTEQEILLNMVIAEGLKGLQLGMNPRLLEDKLKSFLMTEQQKMELGKK
ncbi:MAG: motility protein A [Nitrospinota bacterium]|nr:MAG: motility protein A [Nitrospinota bacterium]